MPAGHHVAAAGVDHLGARRRLQRRPDRGDGAIGDQDVGAPFAVMGDDGAAADKKGHERNSDVGAIMIGGPRSVPPDRWPGPTTAAGRRACAAGGVVAPWPKLPSSSGPGRRPLTAKNRGSSPLGSARASAIILNPFRFPDMAKLVGAGLGGPVRLVASCHSLPANDPKRISSPVRVAVQIAGRHDKPNRGTSSDYTAPNYSIWSRTLNAIRSSCRG